MLLASYGTENVDVKKKEEMPNSHAGYYKMPQKRLIPQILVRNGRAVKGMNFTNHRPVGNPVTLARIYNAQRADEVLIQEIDSDFKGLLRIISSLAGECSMPLIAGGGIRSVTQALEVIREGADGISLGEPSSLLCREIGHLLGRQAITVSIDYKGSNLLWGHDLWHYAERISQYCGEILACDVEREGTGLGLNLPTIKRLREITNCPLVASGGASGGQDIQEAFQWCDGIAIGRLLSFSDQSLPQLTAACKPCPELTKEPGQEHRLAEPTVPNPKSP